MRDSSATLSRHPSTNAPQEEPRAGVGPSLTRGERLTTAAREASRRRWRAFLKPHWPTIKTRLTANEARVLELRLGIGSDVPVTQAQIVRRLQLSIVTVSKLEKSARRKAIAVLTLERAS